MTILDQRFAADIARVLARGGSQAVVAEIICVADDIGVRGELEEAFHRRARSRLRAPLRLLER
jgi:hypothetical protein